MAYYALHKLHILPGKFLRLPEEEKAFICAAIDIKIENEKKEEKKLRKK